ncbi:alanine racemase family [Niveomyces insectorum RCEF 264]|uniref:Pyridoxal phosphate homeostasis protein n=1 Tax=Niveomyces insectorum RCEF 264 TaxID=1081102 RepID=A0A167Z639_9HYPO|nr:alanine racemase family [Niveomyces insectorum RCEF 264]
MENDKDTTTTTKTAAAEAASMKIDLTRAAALTANLQAVRDRLAAAAGGRQVRLVAVSKLHPANDILALHQPAAGAISGAAAPQIHFGENYAQELRDKAALLPRTIRWHFIGGLQSGHCRPLARIPNLECVSSVDSFKKARLLDASRGVFLGEAAAAAATATAAAAAAASSSPDDDVPPPGPLYVHVQVNTSGEASKAGCTPGDETVSLCRAIVEECPHLRLRGLMTIGALARSKAVAAADDENKAQQQPKKEPENPDFVALRAQRDLVQTALGPRAAPLELSMGMSDDFVSAVASGSDEVRIGSTLFGARPAKADAKLVV